MKELSIEEKAKRYDDLLIKLQEAKVDNNVCDDRYCCVIDVIVPELKESEDEKMIQYFKDLAPFDKAEELYEKYGFSHKDAIAWLEKQGEHKKFRDSIQVGDKVTRNEDGELVNLSQLNRVAKKQGEQKPADKVEPRFKVGDWIVREAPEKVYVQLPSRNWIGRMWNETPIKDGDNPNWKNATNIEYTRTDVFIEKVLDFFENKLCCYIGAQDFTIEHGRLEEDFKEYMKL